MRKDIVTATSVTYQKY